MNRWFNEKPSVVAISRSPGMSAALQFMFSAFCLETLFAVPYRSVYLITHSAKMSWVVALLTCMMILLIQRFAGPRIAVVKDWLRSSTESFSSWTGLWLFIGLTLRLGWALRFHASLQSDGLAYFSGAESLVLNHSYPGAFWPPGFAFFLAPLIWCFGAHQWVATLGGLILFAGTYYVSCSLAVVLAGKRAGRVAAAVLALWPGYIAVVGINSKEALLALLVTGAMWLYWQAHRDWNTRVGYVVAAGMLLGWATLTQPGYALFPGVILAYEWLRSRKVLTAVRWTALATVGLLVVVIPWAYRNYVVFHKVILVSTNGGSVFYRANNPKANASYSAEGERSLPADELQADKEGFKEARHWIVSHPLDFMVLAIRKQIVYLGDDGIGVYESLKRGQTPSAMLYGGFKLICNLCWLGLWVILLGSSWKLFQLRSRIAWFGLCFLPLVYQWVIDSVFESGSRHHIAYVGVTAVLVALAISTAGAENMLPGPRLVRSNRVPKDGLTAAVPTAALERSS